MENSNKIILYDFVIICVEVVFVGGDVPYDTYKVGSIDGLKEVLSENYLKEEAAKNDADSAFVQNIYCRANTEDRNNRLEIRIGNTLNLDLEAISYEGDVSQ